MVPLRGLYYDKIQKLQASTSSFPKGKSILNPFYVYIVSLYIILFVYTHTLNPIYVYIFSLYIILFVCTLNRVFGRILEKYRFIAEKGNRTLANVVNYVEILDFQLVIVLKRILGVKGSVLSPVPIMLPVSLTYLTYSSILC